VVDTSIELKTESGSKRKWRENVQTLKISTWLGWQLESNWADPLVFFIFVILRPVASALILLVMYQVIAGGQRDGFFDYLYISNAMFMVVLSVMSGMSWAILEDRENYRMLKYIYTSPARKLAYLAGRAVAKVAIGLFTTLVLLVTGILLLGLKLDVARIEWGWLVIYFVLGICVLTGLGLILAGVALVVARHGGFIGEIVGGSMLLFSGAYSPVDILPPVLKEMSLANPITYWLEGLRRALTGGVINLRGDGSTGAVSPALASLDNVQLLLILGISAVVSLVVAYYFYNWIEHQAKERGMIDRLTGY
jgi:ABC-2 type transport system permease protein